MNRKQAALAVLVAFCCEASLARADDAITIGTEADYAPFETVAPDGSLQGFDVDLARAICADAHLRCSWKNMDFDGLLPALDAHRIDAALSEISVTPEREKKVLFTKLVTKTAAALISASGSGIDSGDLRTLHGKTVGVQSGTTEEVFARSKLASTADIQVYQTQIQAFQDLKAGRLDAVLCDQSVGYDWLKQNSGTYVFSGPPLKDPQIFGIGTAFALRLGNEGLKRRLDRAIKDVVSNGTYKRINIRYFPFSLMPGPG